MKKTLIAAAIFSSLLLTSCFWGGDTNSSLQQYDNDNFSIDIPNSWEILENDDKILPTPNAWEIELAVTSSDIKSGFANNLLVLSQDLNKETTSSDYSRLNYIGSNKDYTNHVALEDKEFTFDDWDITKIYTFEAKYNSTTPTYKFIQLAKVCDMKGYLITIWLSLDVEDTSKYEDFLKTFTCK